MRTLAIYLTDFADAGVIVPVCATVALALLLLRQRQTAFAWVGVTVVVWGLMLALKLSFRLCDDLMCSLPSGLGLVSPSGHVAASSAAYGGLLGLVLRSTGRSFRRSCLAAVSVAVVIGVTRVVLHDHSVAEVVIGGIVGVAGAVAFTSAAREWISGPRREILMVAVIASMLVFHGTHLTWEPEIQAVTSSAIHSVESAR